jgi:hypothetical protein
VSRPPWPPGRPPAQPAPRPRRPENRRPPLLAAPVALPEPRDPVRPPAEPDFGDDPLGTGNIGHLLEASTPLADQSWEIVQRGRRRRDPGRNGTRPAEPGGGGGGGGGTTAQAAPASQPNPFDFLRFEARDDRFRRPPGT